MIAKLKALLSGSDVKMRNYTCTGCETEFSLPNDAPIECPDCDSSELVVPERNIVLVDHQCTDCHTSFKYTDEAELVCPNCDSTNLVTSRPT